MKPKLFIGFIAGLVAIGGGTAIASHIVELDPATVPTGFLAAHSAIADVPVSSLARAVKPDGTEITLQHVRLGPNAATGWHTHPGPGIVTVVKGALTYEDAGSNQCQRTTYSAGQGFVDRGFGHVHRAIAGPEGADFYVVYVLPQESEQHLIPAPAVAECTP
jgi:quercetin dioxygenase-like cupin family protein